MPLNLFPGDPGSIRPGPERGCQESRVIKGRSGPFIEVELGAGAALGLGSSWGRVRLQSVSEGRAL